ARLGGPPRSARAFPARLSTYALLLGVSRRIRCGWILLPKSDELQPKKDRYVHTFARRATAFARVCDSARTSRSSTTVISPSSSSQRPAHMTDLTFSDFIAVTSAETGSCTGVMFT